MRGRTLITIGGGDNLFVAGRSAMVVDDISLFMHMYMGGKSPTFEYGIVTLPVDPVNPDRSSTVRVGTTFALQAQTERGGAAWKVVRYLNGDEYAKLRSRSTTELLSGTGYAVDKNGQSLEAFYKLKPDVQAAAQLYPKGFQSELEQIASEEIEAAVQKKKTIEQAFDSLVVRAREALMRAAANGEVEKEYGGGGAIFFSS